jgi:hypothetical protein
MTYNDNTAAQLLLFPIRQATQEELAPCQDTDVLYFQAKLAITQMLNRSNYRDAEHHRIVNDFNQLCRELGYKTLAIES